MKRATMPILWLVVLVVSTGMLIVSWSDASSATTQYTHTRSRAQQITEHIEAIDKLHANGTSEVRLAAPGEPLASIVMRSLTSAGLGEPQIGQLSGERSHEEQGVNDLRVQRTQATLALTELTLGEFGRWLDAFQNETVSWQIGEIRLAPIHRSESVQRGGDMQISASLALTSTKITQREQP